MDDWIDKEFERLSDVYSDELAKGELTDEDLYGMATEAYDEQSKQDIEDEEL